MKKSESEMAIRRLSREWAKGLGLEPGSKTIPSFNDFKAWARDKDPAYFDFRSIDVDYEAEAWFDDELKQTWRR